MFTSNTNTFYGYLSFLFSFLKDHQEATPYAAVDDNDDTHGVGHSGVRQRKNVGRTQSGAHIILDATTVVHDRGRQRTESVQGLGNHGARRIPEQVFPAAFGQFAVGG